MRSSSPPRAWVIACSFGTSSSTLISEFCRNTSPSSLTETVSGSLSWSSDFAWVCGRSSGTPTVSSGAETMKMMSSTSMTSTIGVTLISAMTGLRRLRRPPPPDELAAIMPIICCPNVPSHDTCRPTAPRVDLTRQYGRKFFGEDIKSQGLSVHIGGELIVENSGRNGGDKADGGRKQRLGDAPRHHRQGGIFRRRDRLEARHDAPDRAEQADEGAGGADGREHQQPAFQPLDLARDRNVHHLVDAHLKACDRAGLAFERALPLAHRRHEAGRHGMRRLGRERAIEVLDRLAGPERLLEAVHRAAGAGKQEDLVDGDRPDPDRAGQKSQHHRFHDPVSLPEQRDQRHVGGGGNRKGGLSHFGRIHQQYPLKTIVT